MSEPTTEPAAKYELRKVADLIEWDENPRTISESEYERLQEHIRRLGVYKPLLINQQNIVLGGNMRLRALKELGIDEVMCAVVLTDNKHQMIEYALSDNEQMGETDQQKLAELVTLNPIKVELFALRTGKLRPVQELIDEYGPETKEDEPPPVADVAVSVLGEIYQLGRHRLMCGDSTDFGSITNLLDGAEPNLLLTDPPYGHGEKWSGGTWANNPMYDDAKKWDIKPVAQEAIDQMIDLAKKAIIWGGNYYRLPPSRCWLAWLKSNKMDTMADFELAWTNFDKPAKAFTESRNADGNRVHPTQKPISLLAWALDKYSESGQVIMDLFGGSGSTLVACEQTDRTCYMMEIAPKYCDVIRKRYAKLTNNNELPENWAELTAKL